MRFAQKTLDQTISFSASSRQVLNIPKQGFITHMDLLLHLNVTTDSGGATPREDALAKIINSLRIISAGAKTHLLIPDGRLLKYLNYYDYQGILREDDLPTSASVTSDVYALWRIHFGYDPREKFDLTVVLPTPELQNPQMIVEWGSTSDLGSGYTINSGEITVTLYQVLFEEGEDPSDLWTEGYVEPIWDATKIDISETKSDLGEQTAIPVGNVLVRALLLVVDSSDLRSDSEVDEVGVILPREGVIPFRVKWNTLVSRDYTDYALPSKVTGVGMIDAEELGQVPFGLDLSEYDVGEILLGFTTIATGGDIYILYQQVT